MTSKTLHITNGDVVTNYLKSLNFSGDFITWREMLCEGKTTREVGSESFWKTRFEFLKDAYSITKHTFINYTLKEYRSLCNKKNSNEIVLWFEHDLFCQINMLAVISWLKKHRKDSKITLVTNQNTKVKGLAYLTEKQIDTHYRKRVVLTKDDIAYADYIWQLYCSDSPLRLETVYKFNTDSPFKHLTPAIEAHLKRFPSIKNGLNSVENYILKTVSDKKFTSEENLIKKLLKNENILGYSNLQYQEKIHSLKGLFHKKHIKLNNLGQEVLEGKENFYRNLRNDKSFLGGAQKYSFLHHNKNNKLLQITS